MNNFKLEQQLDRIEKLLTVNKAVLSFEEACEYTSLSSSFLYKLTSSGDIPFSKPNGKKIFFSKEKLDSWLLQNSSKSNSELEREALNYSLKNKR